MIRHLSVAALFLVALGATSPATWASRTQARAPLGSSVELVVVETSDCRYCALFKRTVLPAYATSPQTRDVPVRFVDAATLKDGAITLTRPVEVVPTAILVRGGIELGRISGYVGRQNFFRSINRLLAGPR